jgi:glycosyltransferase involved in cell wall biosynthesis
LKISIALATYNGSKYLKEQLDSFALQTRLPDEVVVCDDFSSDETVNILECYAISAPFEMKIVANEKNIGYTRNFEKALSLCTGDLIFLSDQDDVWNKNKISKILELKYANPHIEVFINDAIYVDENLKPSGISVLNKVLRFSGNDKDHIAGACTAITRNFNDFLLPFPLSNCPLYDVYIHRWANLLKNKLVVPIVYQCWRIHGNNNSASEMNNPKKLSFLKLFIKYRSNAALGTYAKEASEFNEMALLISLRKSELMRMERKVDIDKLKVTIDEIVIANITRSLLVKANFFMRIRLAILMLSEGHYKHFKGLWSMAKDILR